MFEELFAKVPDVDAYLERIGYEGSRDISAETLNALVRAHLRAVPFENMDVIGGGEADLSISALYDKVVIRGRGGFCFELNALFMALLETLGFDCYPVGGRVAWGKTWRGALGHRATVITIDGVRYFCDVGFGGPMPDGAALLDFDGIQSFSSGDFRIRHENGEAIIGRVVEDGFEDLLVFAPVPFDRRDFVPLCYYYANSPKSVFTMAPMINLRTDTGSKSIDGMTMRIRENGVLTETELKSQDELKETLKEHFGIVI